MQGVKRISFVCCIWPGAEGKTAGDSLTSFTLEKEDSLKLFPGLRALNNEDVMRRTSTLSESGSLVMGAEGLLIAGQDVSVSLTTAIPEAIHGQRSALGHCGQQGKDKVDTKQLSNQENHFNAVFF